MLFTPKSDNAASLVILSRIPLWPFMILSLAMIGLDFQRPSMMQDAQLRFSETLQPFYAAASFPWRKTYDGWIAMRSVWTIRADVQRLSAENTELKTWRSQAEVLRSENEGLKALLHFSPTPTVPFTTVHVAADLNGIYTRSVLIPGEARNGDVVLDQAGVVGRVTQVGNRLSTIMLLTDAASRVPVLLGDDHSHAMLAGDNGPLPALLYWPEGVTLHEGEIVVTSAEGGVFPAGLPVGTVHIVDGHPKVVLAAQLKYLDLVKVFHEGSEKP